MIELNNPAGRLHHLLREVKNKGNVHATEALGEVLGVPKENKAELYRRLGLFCDLPNQVIEQIESLPDENHKLLLKKLPVIQNSFKTLNLQASLTNFTKNFDESVFYCLEVCSDTLSKKAPEKILEKEKLKELKNEIETLIEETISSNLTEELKSFILKHLRIILVSIQEYAITGISEIEKSLRETFGSIVTNNESYKRSIETETGSKFWEFAGKLALVVSITGGILQIGETINDAIPEIKSAIECSSEVQNNPEIKAISESFEYQENNKLQVENKT